MALALEPKAHALRDHRVILDQQQLHGNALLRSCKVCTMRGAANRPPGDRDNTSGSSDQVPTVQRIEQGIPLDWGKYKGAMPPLVQIIPHGIIAT